MNFGVLVNVLTEWNERLYFQDPFKILLFRRKGKKPQKQIDYSVLV